MASEQEWKRITLKDKLLVLIQLQQCDNRIEKILQAKEQCPLRIQKLEDEVRVMESQFKADEDQIEAFRKDRRVLEREIQELDGKIEKSSTKLTQVKSNKEYTAALKEIDDLKTIKFQTEEKAIQIMETAEELEQKCKGQKETLKTLKDKCEKDKEEINKDLLDLERNLEALEKERNQLCSDFDQSLLKKSTSFSGSAREAWPSAQWLRESVRPATWEYLRRSSTNSSGGAIS